MSSMSSGRELLWTELTLLEAIGVDQRATLTLVTRLTKDIEILANQLSRLTHTQGVIMTKVEELQGAVIDLKSHVSSVGNKVLADLKILKDQIASGIPITSEQLDALIGTVKGIDASVGSVETQAAAQMDNDTSNDDITPIP